MSSSTLRRHIRDRMKKTGESYQTAHRNYLKTHPKQESGPAEVAPTEATPSPSIFDLVLESLAEVRPTPPPLTSEEEEAQKDRLWAELKTAARKQLSPRAAERLLAKLQKKGLSTEELRGAVNYLSALPRGYLLQEQEWINQQVRLATPILEQAAAIPDLARQAQEILNHAQASLATVDATRQALDDLSAARLASAEIEASRGIAQDMLDAINSTPTHSIYAALEEFENGPVAAALRLVNEGPVAEALRYVEQEDAVSAASRHLNNSAVAAAMRLQKDRLTETPKSHRRHSS